MTKLAGVIPFRRNATPSQSNIRRLKSGVQRRATSGENDSTDIAQLGRPSCSVRPVLQWILQG